MTKPHYLVLCGPGGSGKNTIYKALQNAGLPIERARAYTTRPRRPHEDDDQYWHIGKLRFWWMSLLRKFPLHNWFSGNGYGITHEDIEKVALSGTIVLLDVNVIMVPQVRTFYPDALIIYLDIGTQVMRKRLRDSRPWMTAEQLEERMEIGGYERNFAVSQEKDLGIRILPNYKVEETVRTIKQLIGEHFPADSS